MTKEKATPTKKKEAAPKVADKAPEKESAPVAEKKAAPDYVKVRSVAKVSLRQFSTGIVIYPGNEKDMKNDGWLHSQITARYLEKV